MHSESGKFLSCFSRLARLVASSPFSQPFRAEALLVEMPQMIEVLPNQPGELGMHAPIPWFARVGIPAIPGINRGVVIVAGMAHQAFLRPFLGFDLVVAIVAFVHRRIRILVFQHVAFGTGKRIPHWVAWLNFSVVGSCAHTSTGCGGLLVVDCDFAAVSGLVEAAGAPRANRAVPQKNKTAAAAKPRARKDFPLAIPFTAESILKPV